VIEDLTDLSRTAEPPDWLQQVAEFPWNGVFTTAIDGLVPRAFDAEWRRVVPVVGRDVRRQPRRSPTELRLALLYGGVGLAPGSEPPADRPSFAIRRSEARELLSELAEGLLTPRGVLVVEGFATSDWLAPEDLYALASQLLPGQMHLFSASHDVLEDEFIQAAVASRSLVTHTSSLAQFLGSATDTGALARPPLQVDIDARFLRLSGHLHPVPRDVWNRVLPAGRPLDASLLVEPPAASSSALYQSFRDFLDSAEGVSLWSGLARGFNFDRSFERSLAEKVVERLSGEEVPDPLVVAGQSGSGKSVALANLARSVAFAGTYAVLHVPRRPARPQISAVDEFALWAESVGSRGLLVIWDGMLDTDDYFTLARQLRGRGRKALIVGSTYRSTGLPRGTINVPGTLDAAEAQRVQLWLARFSISIAQRDRPLLQQDASFLAALYRLLPETRRGIQRGLVLELRGAEATMERRAAAIGDTRLAAGGTVLADAMRRAGLMPPLLAPGATREGDTSQATFADRSTAERLTNMVVAAGQHDVNVPLELVLCAVGREGALAIVELIKQVDIIRWYEDENGEQMLGLRTALEGRILASAEFGSPRVEWEALAELLRELRPRPGFGGPEVQFAIDLLQKVGPQSQERERYVAGYLIFVEALREARSATGHDHPRLLLAEANLAREFAKWNQAPQGRLTREERLAVFREAERALETALELRPAPQTRLNLLVELASNLGSQLHEATDSGAVDSDVVHDLATRVLDCVQQARALDPTNYYPVDVVGWVARRALERGQLDDAERIRILADTAASFESVDRDQLTPGQLAKFDSRSAEVAELLNDPAAADEHLARLEANEDPSAFYLLALRRSGIGRGEVNAASAAMALEFLRAAPPEVRGDWRCARLTLDLFWISLTGRRFLSGRAQPLNLPLDDWDRAFQLASELGPHATFDVYRFDFLRALALFHVGRFQESESAFVELDKGTSGLAQRIQTSFLESNPDGSPAIFTGQVQSVRSDQSHGTVWVDQLGVELPFIPRRFTQEEVNRGEPLPEFVIEFNFRGPYAYPARLSRSSRPRESIHR
jgi:hypothetical protein